MSKRKLLATASIAVASALAFSACTPATPTTPGNTGSTAGSTAAATGPTALSVAWNQAFYSRNSDTDYGNATANANILYLTNDSIGYYDEGLNIAQNSTFGKYEKVSDDPLKVKVTLADTATWSDGTPVTAADAVLLWGAVSTNFNTVEADAVTTDEETGEVSGVEGDNVYFNAASPGHGLIKDFPEINGDKEFTVTFSEPFVDWEILAMSPVGVPAHVVAKRALESADAKAGQQAILDAFKNNDRAALAKIAKVWNNDFNFKSMPTDEELVVSSGPYVITEMVEEQYLTVEKNANYKGMRMPKIDKITVRIIPDAQASVQALQNGEVAITQPQSTADILKQLQDLAPKVETLTQSGGTYEHVDLVFNNGGPFDPASYGGDAEKAKKVRQAFLQTLPRQRIIDNIIKPLNPEAEIRNTFNVVPGSPEYDATAEANGMEATYGGGSNVDKAKALLAEAGVTNPTVRMMFAQNNTRRQQEFQLIKETAEQAGFSVVDASSTDWGQLLSTNDVYDASLFGWQSTSVGVSQVPPNYLSNGQNNYGGFNNAEVDKLLNELNVTTDTDRQNEIVRTVEKILVDEAFGLTIFQFPEITGIDTSKVKNVSSIPLSPTYFWNFWEWETVA